MRKEAMKTTVKNQSGEPTWISFDDGPTHRLEHGDSIEGPYFRKLRHEPAWVRGLWTLGTIVFACLSAAAAFWLMTWLISLLHPIWLRFYGV